MGIDFIKKVTPSFKKGWDNNKCSLAEPNLFTSKPSGIQRTVVAVLNDLSNVSKGMDVLVKTGSNGLVVVHENAIVGYLESPPPDLHKIINQKDGIALGKIEHINLLGGTADVEVC